MDTTLFIAAQIHVLYVVDIANIVKH